MPEDSFERISNLKLTLGSSVTDKLSILLNNSGFGSGSHSGVSSPGFSDLTILDFLIFSANPLRFWFQ